MADTPRPRNILIFLVDEVTHDYTRPGHPCHMPNVRRLARQGLSFTHAYTCSPHCCPSRATFMTGLYPSRHGVFNNVNNPTAFQMGLNPGVRTFSEDLRDAGYQLAYAGKYHISNEESPAARGWRELGEYGTHIIRPKPGLWQRRAAEPAPPDASRQFGQILRPGWGHVQAFGPVIDGPDALHHDRFYDTAILPGLRAIAELASSGRSWCLCVSTDMDHRSPVPKQFADLYDPAKIELPPSFHDPMLDKPRVYQRMRNMLWGQLTEDEARHALAHYYALCSMQDHYLGMLLDALDKTGQADDTLVLFLADHGDLGYQHGLADLGIPAFDPMYHIPAVIRWPRGIDRPGRDVDAIVSIADFAPTFTQLAGRQPAPDLTGRSLVPFLQNCTPDDWPDSWCSQTKGNETYFTQRIVRTRRWKYVVNWFDFDEFYDLQNDPHELHNLAFPQPGGAPPTDPHGRTHSQTFTPWPHLAPELESVRRDLLARLWRFALRENDIIQDSFPPVALAPYGPLVALKSPPSP
ncbi:MAG: sulfatase-like hydrolase/transferase [Phycisphaeraceae bacterium]|nr:sulfatase-like hydrolase/transferase [Phycisphaeraceae bacterium]